MKRRDFFKTLGGVAAGAATSKAIGTVTEVKADGIVKADLTIENLQAIRASSHNLRIVKAQEDIEIGKLVSNVGNMEVVEFNAHKHTYILGRALGTEKKGQHLLVRVAV